jgi:hypothetical protein
VVLRGILEPREEVIRNGKMDNEGFHNLHPSPNIISVLKIRRPIKPRQVARMVQMRKVKAKVKLKVKVKVKLSLCLFN